MSGRTHQITIYVTAERKTELQQRADDRDDSVSGVINDMIERQLQHEAQDVIASETRAEERIQELVSLGVEEMAATAAEIRDMNAKFGTYAIANFEMLKRDHSAHVRKTALTTGARRIRQDLDTITEGGPGEPTVADDGTGEPDTGTAASLDANQVAIEDADPDGVEHGGEKSDAEDEEPDLFDRLRSDRE